MKVANFKGPGIPVVIEEAELPCAGPYDVIVKVQRCGICGSDVSMTGDAPFTFQTGPIGHEYAGEIVEVGSQVKELRSGMRVACLPTTPCGQCEGCRRGNPIFCASPKGVCDGRRYGGFGEYVAIPAGGAKIIPDWLTYADGALVEPMACGLHALRKIEMEPDSRVLVLGAGAMAMSIVYWARRMGRGRPRIIVASRSPHRRGLALAMGADGFHSFAHDDPAELVHQLGGPADIVAECVGKPGMLKSALEQVRPEGKLISLGMCQHAEPILPAAFSFKDASVVFPVGYTVDEFVETARAFDADNIHPELMVSDVISLRALPRVLEELRGGQLQAMKIHVNPAQDY